jgi:hypothetical protein
MCAKSTRRPECAAAAHPHAESEVVGLLHVDVAEVCAAEVVAQHDLQNLPARVPLQRQIIMRDAGEELVHLAEDRPLVGRDDSSQVVGVGEESAASALGEGKAALEPRRDLSLIPHLAKQSMRLSGRIGVPEVVEAGASTPSLIRNCQRSCRPAGRQL